MQLTRRSALLGLSSAVTLGGASLALADAPTEKRFVVIILRGGLDGLSTVVPYGDPAVTGLRAEIIPAAPGQEGGVLDLGGFYGLHPSMPGLHAMYRSGELLILHAVAGPYRTRSHFDAQDYLECGTDHRLTSGWLSRAAAALHPQSNGSDGDPIAIGVTIPLLLRGATRVGSWGPSSFQRPPAYLYQAAADLAATDPMIGPALRDGLRERNFTRDALARGETPKGGNDFVHLAAAAGQILANPNGPRVAALEMSGFDTHSAQLPLLRMLLGRLDAGLVALKQRIGGAWRDTVVLTMTEFGRTARVNGTKGTDHGTAGVAFLVGGAIAGGRVVADWPGLGSDRLFEGRDLQPTTDLRSVAKGVLAQHLGLNAAQLAKVFPDSTAATSMRGLIRT